MDTQQGLGEFIRSRRTQLGMSQTALANQIGLGRSHLAQIEGGKIGMPSADIRRRLAEALKVRHVDLLVAAGELTMAEVDSVNARTDIPPDVWASYEFGLLGTVWNWTRGHPERENLLKQLMGNLKE